MTGGGNAPRGHVDSLLDQVPRVAARPLPPHLVIRGGSVESLPPGEICLASKAPVHRFDYVARVSKQTDLARLRQRFQPDRSGGDFRLLICSLAEIFANCAPKSFVTQQRNRGGARSFLSIAATRAIAEDPDLLQFGIIVSHS